jgi:hypothetical protein
MVSQELELLKNYVLDKTVLHIGGHKGQEGKLYKKFTKGFAFVEPMPDFAKLINDKGYKVFNCAVTNYQGYKEFIVMKNSQRSSLQTADEDVAIPHTKIMVQCVPLIAIQKGFNTLVIDAQGESYNILISGDLRFFDTVICEASKNPRYSDEKDYTTIIQFMTQQGFKFVDELQHKTKDIYDLVFKR